MGFGSLNTFSYRHRTLSANRWVVLHSRPILPPLRNYTIKSSNSPIHVSQRVINQLKSILGDNRNVLFKLQVFLDYLYNSIVNEVLPYQLEVLSTEFHNLIEEKSRQYCCSWDDMLELIREYTSLRFEKSSSIAAVSTPPSPMSPATASFLYSIQAVETPQQEKSPSYHSQKMSTMKKNYDEEEKRLIDPTASLHIDRLVSQRIDVAYKKKGYALQASELWDDDVSQSIMHVLIKARKIVLTANENSAVDAVLNGRSNEEVVTSKFGFEMTRKKLICLRPGIWLNDEVINFYMQMLQIRDEELIKTGHKRRKSYFFSSFFMQRLLEDNGGYTYANIKRWSKKVDIFSLDKAIFPINLGNTHWTLGVCYMQKKEIHYYDSMSGGGKKYLDAMMRWIVDEGREKKGITVNPSEYTRYTQHDDTPQQRNGVDCGVFTTICADFIIDDLPIKNSSYNQGEMHYYRRKILADILRGSLLYPMICNPSNPPVHHSIES